jgi:hypothetical protein
MSIVARLLPRDSSSYSSRRCYRIGLRSNGHLEELVDLEQAVDWINEGPFRNLQINIAGYWILRHYIYNSAGDPVLVSTIGSNRAFTETSWRNQGIDLLEKVIGTLETGVQNISQVGSDNSVEIDPFDLASLQAAYENGETEGFFTLIGVTY